MWQLSQRSRPSANAARSAALSGLVRRPRIGQYGVRNSTLFERSELRRISAILLNSGEEAARSLDFLCLLSCIKTRK